MCLRNDKKFHGLGMCSSFNNDENECDSTHVPGVGNSAVGAVGGGGLVDRASWAHIVRQQAPPGRQRLDGGVSASLAIVASLSTGMYYILRRKRRDMTPLSRPGHALDVEQVRPSPRWPRSRNYANRRRLLLNRFRDAPPGAEPYDAVSRRSSFQRRWRSPSSRSWLTW